MGAVKPTFPARGPRDGLGAPIGRRVVLGMLGLGAVGVVAGARVSNGVGDLFASVGGSSLVPGADFQLYTVTDGFPAAPADYHLEVDGLVERPMRLAVDDLKAMPVTSFSKPFQCVTGWRVNNVPWKGVTLWHLLQEAGVKPEGKALQFGSFDGVYTESLTLDQAKRTDIVVAYDMLGGPVSREHGGPVRLYVAPMYGYKSIKWMNRISVVDRVIPGYWEHYGCDVNAWIGRSNGRDDAPIS